MKKARKILGIIALILFFIDLIIIVYFTFIHKSTKTSLDPASRVNPNYRWVLYDSGSEVAEQTPITDNQNIKNIDAVQLNHEEAVSFKDSPVLKYPLYIHDGYLYMTLGLGNNHDMDVVFISPNSNAFKYHVRSFGDDDQIPVKYSELPRGQYRIYIVDNGDKYDTTQFITIN